MQVFKPTSPSRKDGRSAEQTGKKRYQGDADEGDTAAGHQLLHALVDILAFSYVLPTTGADSGLAPVRKRAPPGAPRKDLLKILSRSQKYHAM